jgi:hypothetical protein
MESILARIDALAAKLGVAAAHVYEVLCRQALIAGVWYAIAGLAFLVFAGFLVHIYRVNKPRYKDGDIPPELALFFAFMSLVPSGMFFYEATTCLYNPEMYALGQIALLFR